MSQHPSIVPADFDITREGKLVLHVSPEFAVACEAATLPLNSSIMVQVRSLFPSGLGSRVSGLCGGGNGELKRVREGRVNVDEKRGKT